MNYRGQALGYIIDGSFVLVVLMSFYFLFSMFAVNVPEPLHIEAELIVNRLLHTPEGISHIDPITQRVYPYILDASKFEDPEIEMKLSELLYYGTDQKYAVKVTYTDPKDAEKHDIYINERWYVRWRPLVGAGIKLNSVNKILNMLVDVEGKLKPTRVVIEVVAKP